MATSAGNEASATMSGVRTNLKRVMAAGPAQTTEPHIIVTGEKVPVIQNTIVST